MKTLLVIHAGLSSPSTTGLVAEKIATAVKSSMANHGEGLKVDTVEIRTLATDLAAMMTTGIPSVALQSVQEKLSAADALIVATPIFAASYSGLFKMFFDSLDTDALNAMPIVIAATAGTARHQLVLDYAVRPLMSYFRAHVMPTGIFAATEDFGNEQGASLQKRIARAAEELLPYLLKGLAGNCVDSGATVAGLARSSGVNVPTEGFNFEDLLPAED